MPRPSTCTGTLRCVVFSPLYFLPHLSYLSLSQDGEPAEAFSVLAAHFPFFHPKDSPPIVAFVGVANTHNYVYWSGTRWTRTDSRITVSLNVPTYLRSSNVNDCPNAPTALPILTLDFVPETPTRQRLQRSRYQFLTSLSHTFLISGY